ncbi:hypothetical protein GCM10022225_63960 [Plantactinospora mayteni]|uniref:Glycine zipper domain-containing protein n=1 Tax=Plantactinospora mayteni TaxID=566021 RepID=A0ABQ4F0D4_9ACTN|nr:hypothetical protein [Plantactinospora mayteni]GIH00325.1 hypothetical protein Pma05_68970 [Plantactinospora mayteni]
MQQFEPQRQHPDPRAAQRPPSGREKADWKPPVFRAQLVSIGAPLLGAGLGFVIGQHTPLGPMTGAAVGALVGQAGEAVADAMMTRPGSGDNQDPDQLIALAAARVVKTALAMAGGAVGAGIAPAIPLVGVMVTAGLGASIGEYFVKLAKGSSQKPEEDIGKRDTLKLGRLSTGQLLMNDVSQKPTKPLSEQQAAPGQPTALDRDATDKLPRVKQADARRPPNAQRRTAGAEPGRTQHPRPQRGREPSSDQGGRSDPGSGR